MADESWVQVAKLEDLKQKGAQTVQIAGLTVVLFLYGDKVFAADNRCPHMGFPLQRGTINDGILTCHWHHARFDLRSGGTFDQWADDLTTFVTEIRDGKIWIDLSTRRDPHAYQMNRLKIGLERNISLVIAKSVINLFDLGVDPAIPFRQGIEFGAKHRLEGWGQGLTILTCMINMLPHLDEIDRRRALYHGLSAVSSDTAAMAPRFELDPLPEAPDDIVSLKNWFRQFIEVRDADGAERCIATALVAGADDRQMADMMYAAVTDHRYISTGHPLDFTNKAFEALDIAGWDMAGSVLTSLVHGYANATRMEESNAWRYPIDLIDLLESAFSRLPTTLSDKGQRDGRPQKAEIIETLLGDDPQITIELLLASLRRGYPPVDLAGLVARAAALRIARFHTSNEFGDWDTALHTFTFANAVHQGLQRSPVPQGSDSYPPLLRGVFDAAMSVYLDRFLNIPPARSPSAGQLEGTSERIFTELEALLNRQHQVEAAAGLVASLAGKDRGLDDLMPVMGHLLLREDRDFHTIQTIEAAFRQYKDTKQDGDALDFLIAAIRYLAAHAPTMRAQEQRYQIAHRLSRGEQLHEGESTAADSAA